MLEGKNGVKRLLNALNSNVTNSNIQVLASMLNYDERQLKDDLESIKDVVVLNKDEFEE